MTEERSKYIYPILNNLSKTERDALDHALQVLTPGQILSVAMRVRGMEYGRVFITVEKGHPRFVGIEETFELGKEVNTILLNGDE